MKQILTNEYNPRLDGLRAIAILLVVFSHYSIPGFKGGGVGVDIFFVLSGFLITRVLIKGLEKKESLFLFYWRRFLRLIPALAFLSLTIGLTSLISKDLISRTIAFQDIFTSFFYIANWTRAFSLGIPTLLGNCWSLAIEEQFYLIWPLLFTFLNSKKKFRINILVIMLIFLFVSIIWPYYLEFKNIDSFRIYNGFDTHCSGLIIGCCMALFLKKIHSEEFLKKISKLWPLFLLVLFYLLGNNNLTVTSTALIADVVAVIFILTAQYYSGSIMGKFLGTMPVVAIGKISYSLYLWHYPIFLVLYLNRLSWIQVVGIGIPFSFLVAVFSYQIIEKRMLLLKYLPKKLSRKLGMVAVSLSVLGMFTSGIYFFHETIKDTFFPAPINILNYGPQQVKVGEGFNVQVDGESYLWMVISRTLPKDTKILIGNNEYKINITGRTISAMIPRDILLEVGKKELLLISPVGTSLAPPVSFDVIGN